MESILVHYYCSERKEECFWEDLKNPEYSQVEPTVLESNFYIPRPESTYKKQKYILTSKGIFLVSKNLIPVKYSGLAWKTVEELKELPEGFYGFRVSSSSVLQDFYTRSCRTLKMWLKNLRKMCILTGFKSEYRKIKKIGEGNYSEVFLAKALNSNKKFAVKCIKKERLLKTESGLEHLVQEIQAMRVLDHPNVPKLHRVYESSNKFYLVQDYLKHKNLCTLISEEGNFSEEKAAKVMKKLLGTLHYLHSENVVHRDIKLENVLLGKNLEVKLIDLGLACTDVEETQKPMCGSPGYLAPEMLHKEVYGTKVDMFSAGVMLYAMLYRMLPFSGCGTKQVLKNNKKCKLEFPSLKCLSISEEAKDLMSKLIESNPQKRISASEAVLHPWIAKFNQTNHFTSEFLEIHS